jgi:hypothetical protein
MRKYIVFFSLIFFAVAVKAALPALILPFMAEAVEAIVVRSAGRQIVSTLGTAAANDTTFAAAVTALRGTQVATWLGFGAVTAAFPGNVEAPESPALAKEKYLVQVIPSASTEEFKPAKISAGYYVYVMKPGTWEELRVYGKTREEAVNNWIAKAKVNSDYVPSGGIPTSWKPYSAMWNDLSQDNWSIQVFTPDDPANGCCKGVYRSDLVEPRDGQRRVLIKNGQFFPDSEDPDWSANDIAEFGKPASFGFVSKNANNERIRVGITATETKLKINEDVETLTPDNKPQIVSRELELTQAGAAVGTSSGVKVGQTLETQPAQWNDGTASNQDGATSGWPDDYARQATLSSVDSGVVAINKSVNDVGEFLKKKEELDDPAIPDSGDILKQVYYFDSFKDLLAWRMPSIKSQCPVVEYQSVLDGYVMDVRIDAHCTIMTPEHYAMLRLIMLAAWTLSAMWVLLEA